MIISEESKRPSPVHLSGYTPTSTLESGFNPQLVYASQRIRIMQKSKSTSGYSVPKVLSPCKHYITLTALTDLHPSTSGVIPYFTHCAMKPLSETPIHWPFKGHAVTCTNTYCHFRNIMLYGCTEVNPFEALLNNSNKKLACNEQQG